MGQALPHLLWLRAFEAAARHLSFTQAASELNLTQAAISKQVKLLEHHLGEPLFERRARSLVLTKTGAAYLPKVRDGFARLIAGTEEVFGGRLSDPLTLRAPVGFAATWLMPHLHDFTLAHPDRPVHLISSVWDDSNGAARVDMEIRYGRGIWTGHTADRLTWEEFEPLCAPSLLQSGPPLTAAGDLSDHRLLHVLGYEEGWSTWCQHLGIEDLNPGQGMQFDNSLTAFEFAAQGGGVALGRSSMAAPYLASGRLVRAFDGRADLPPVPLKEAFYLTSPSGRKAHPTSALLRDHLLAQAAAARGHWGDQLPSQFPSRI